MQTVSKSGPMGIGADRDLDSSASAFLDFRTSAGDCLIFPAAIRDQLGAAIADLPGQR